MWKGNVDEDIMAIEIMEKFWWTYEEYLNTPKIIIDKIRIKDEVLRDYNKAITKDL